MQTAAAQTHQNLTVEAELVDDVSRNVGLDGLLRLALSGFQQPIELLRVKLLHTPTNWQTQT